MGPACDQRVCPYTIAWDIPAHPYAECGNKGDCDRGSGLCKCYDGYSGSGCARLSCVGETDCNGHGTCNPIGDSTWDGTKILACTCDPGYSGPSCLSRMCKPGDDPLTPDIDLVEAAAALDTALAAAESDFSGGDDPPTYGHASHIIQIEDDADAGGEFVITYTDWRGETWSTWALDLDDASAIQVEEALEGLPNHAIPEVKVTYTEAGTGAPHRWAVTFNSAHNTGTQEGALDVLEAGCASDGCQPVYAGLGGLTGGVTQGVLRETEFVTCSNRGTCNSESGLCECADGYFGEACERQTTIL